MNLPIRTWSYSGLSDYEKCPLLFYGRRVEKRPEPPSKALEKGKAAHSAIESYLKGETDEVPKVGAKVSWLLEPLRAAGQGFSVEEKFALTANWRMTGFFDSDAWVRGVYDVQCFYGDDEQEIIDWKTGRAYPEHADSARLYAMTAMSRYTAVQSVKVRYVYLETGEQKEWVVERHNVERMQDYWRARVTPMMTATEFMPTPGDHCRYCPFSNKKGGPCPAG